MPSDLPVAVTFNDSAPPSPGPLLAGRRIAIARDAAYGFIYPANIDTLESMGAELVFFSPIAGETLPPGGCDAVWLPGGYPELHAEALSANRGLWDALRTHALDDGKPLLAECGGMMSLLDEVVDKAGKAHSMAGLLPGRAVMQQRVAALGTQFVTLEGGSDDGDKQRVIAGHTFHFSKTETGMEPLTRAVTPDGNEGEAVYRTKRLTASYMHLYFPSAPQAVAALFLP